MTDDDTIDEQLRADRVKSYLVDGITQRMTGTFPSGQRWFLEIGPVTHIEIAPIVDRDPGDEDNEDRAMTTWRITL